MEQNEIFDESLIKITSCEVLGKLPDPFLMNDGTRADTAEKWRERRKEIYKSAVELQYGTLPPEPEFLDAELIYFGAYGKTITYRIHTGRRDYPVSFLMRVFIPEEAEGACPPVIDGDLCFVGTYKDDFVRTFTDNGIMLVLFDRTELAHDVKGEGRGKGPLYDAYPEYTFGAIGAWAWGYSRCVDALLKLGLGDMSRLTFTGTSRGGKTAALAGAVDERAVIVNPNATCAGGCGCYRIHMTAINEEGIDARSERLADLWHNFPYWMGPELGKYADDEASLPFDCHFLKALIAPRTLFVSEGASDIWANPVGSWQTTQAAREVYKLLGAEDKVYWHFRRGTHDHKTEDILRLINVIKHENSEEELSDRFFRLPFPEPELIFDWRCPEKQ